jgi:hypothetical protein
VVSGQRLEKIESCDGAPTAHIGFAAALLEFGKDRKEI